MFHMVTVFPLSWVFLFTREIPARFLMIEAGAAALGVAAIVCSHTGIVPLGGMTAMYALMSLFHASPWFPLVGARYRRWAQKHF